MKKIVNQRNPILPLDVHIPDVEARVFPDGRLYLYGSCDLRDDVYCSEEYHVVSTADMKEWTVHEAALRGADIPWFGNPEAPHYPGIDWSHPTPFIRKLLASSEGREAKDSFEIEEKPPLLFAPDCIEKDGKYYLFFCMADDSEGTAVSDSPTGPFTDPRQLPCGGIDPSVFIDEDGTAYLYWGQLHSHGVELDHGLRSFNRQKIVDDLVTEECHFFHEGSSMRRIGNTYYYLYADMERGKPTALGYSTGPTPLGPFTYRGIIIDNDGCDPAAWNNHGSLQCFGGQWYVFYHRSSRNSPQHRRLCIEKVSIAEDGSIPEVKMTSQGIGDPFHAGEKIFGYQACTVIGAAHIDCDSGPYGEALILEQEGDGALFRYVRTDKGFSGIHIEAEGSADIDILLDGRPVGHAHIRNGDAQVRLAPAAGEFELELSCRKADACRIQSVTLEED